MKRTIKRRIFTVNILTITLLLVITAVAFNLVARSYLEQHSLRQLHTIANNAERVMQMRPSPFRMGNKEGDEAIRAPGFTGEPDLVESYINLLRSLRMPSFTINAEYALIDKSNHIITPFESFNDKPTKSDLTIIEKIIDISEERDSNRLTFSYNGTQYAAVIKTMSLADGSKAGTLLIYSSLQKINEMQTVINFILVGILLVAALIVLILSTILSKKISSPLSTLCNHIRSLSELNFSNTLHVPADNEIQELVQNINTMAEKLDNHNKSQKLFLQNASHEFRTPIMSIQCHAEGILYGVVEGPEAARIILDESKRLTHMVEELLYLSRLDAIEEIYNHQTLDMNELIKGACERMASIAESSQITLDTSLCKDTILLNGDGEKLERCLSNIISNGIRYAKSTVRIESGIRDDKALVTVSDDGQGFDSGEENQIFNRFYKGKKGNTGLGLAISKSIIEKHHGKIEAQSTETGAKFILELPLMSKENTKAL